MTSMRRSGRNLPPEAAIAYANRIVTGALFVPLKVILRAVQTVESAVGRRWVVVEGVMRRV